MTDLGLVIEDDEDLAFIFSEALENADYQVETLRDGLSAQRRLFEVVPQLVILDMHVPIISGEDILKQIRSDERLHNTVIVMATADARLGEAYTDIADFVLIKPIAFTQLRDLTARLHSI
jgi:two-component system, cell cycle response regulator DivK